MTTERAQLFICGGISGASVDSYGDAVSINHVRIDEFHELDRDFPIAVIDEDNFVVDGRILQHICKARI